MPDLRQALQQKNLKRHFEDVHSDTVGICSKCPKEYKTISNRTKHDKKYQPGPHPPVRVAHCFASTACLLDTHRSEWWHPTHGPSKKLGSNSRKEVSQCQEQKEARNLRNAPQLSSSKKERQELGRRAWGSKWRRS